MSTLPWHSSSRNCTLATFHSTGVITNRSQGNFWIASMFWLGVVFCCFLLTKPYSVFYIQILRNVADKKKKNSLGAFTLHLPFEKPMLICCGRRHAVFNWFGGGLKNWSWLPGLINWQPNPILLWNRQGSCTFATLTGWCPNQQASRFAFYMCLNSCGCNNLNVLFFFQEPWWEKGSATLVPAVRQKSPPAVSGLIRLGLRTRSFMFWLFRVLAALTLLAPDTVSRDPETGTYSQSKFT